MNYEQYQGQDVVRQQLLVVIYKADKILKIKLFNCISIYRCSLHIWTLSTVQKKKKPNYSLQPKYCENHAPPNAKLLWMKKKCL